MPPKYANVVPSEASKRKGRRGCLCSADKGAWHGRRRRSEDDEVTALPATARAGDRRGFRRRRPRGLKDLLGKENRETTIVLSLSFVTENAFETNMNKKKEENIKQ